MVFHRTFRLTKDTIRIETMDNRQTAIMVPAGSIIDMVRLPTLTDTRLLDVRWRGRLLVMFYQDFDTPTESLEN